MSRRDFWLLIECAQDLGTLRSLSLWVLCNPCPLACLLSHGSFKRFPLFCEVCCRNWNLLVQKFSNLFVRPPLRTRVLNRISETASLASWRLLYHQSHHFRRLHTLKPFFQGFQSFDPLSSLSSHTQSFLIIIIVVAWRKNVSKHELVLILQLDQFIS